MSFLVHDKNLPNPLGFAEGLVPCKRSILGGAVFSAQNDRFRATVCFYQRLATRPLSSTVKAYHYNDSGTSNHTSRCI